MPEASGNFIDGEWKPSQSGETFEVTDPADATTAVAEFPQSDEEDAIAAVESARNAKADWATLPGPERGELLRKAASIPDDRSEDASRTAALSNL